MFILPVPAHMVKSAIHNRKVLKYANKACHKALGGGIKDSLQTADAMGLINLEFIKSCIKWYKKLYF